MYVTGNEDNLISIIVPVYNSECFIDKCVESILNQTFRNIEVILVNDGSNDNSLLLCNKWNKIDSRIKVIDQSNGGVSAARNSGLNAATGKYITFVDSDDYIENDMIEKLYSWLVTNNCDASACGYFLHKGKTTITPAQTREKMVFDTEESLLMLLSNDYYQGFLWNKLFKREVFISANPNGFLNEISMCEDLVAVANVILSGISFCYNNEPLYHYIFNDNSIVNSINDRRYTELYARRILIDKLSSIGGRTLCMAKCSYVSSAANLMYLSKCCKNRVRQHECKTEFKKFLSEYLTNNDIVLKEKLKTLVKAYLPVYIVNTLTTLNSVFKATKQHLNVKRKCRLNENS